MQSGQQKKSTSCSLLITFSSVFNLFYCFDAVFGVGNTFWGLVRDVSPASLKRPREQIQ